ncbi:hypothetical protein AB0B51_30085 [Streptomyces griseus]|uniref:hypothetical protein n=1 Tax=Streptomyces griseus TaxID=1911 RepID=UPI0004C9D4CC|nr:hypothetical protein [Streptomyces griseus]
MTQISFPLNKADEALDQFLNDGDRERNGRRVTRIVLDGDDQDCLAVILDPAEHQELVEAHAAFQRSQEPQHAADLPAGFRPYIHSPNATGDRLLPTEPLREPLAHAMYGKPHSKLTEDEKATIIGVSINILLRVTLDEDTQGAVPILMVSHAKDDPEPRQFWQLAYKTDTDGLFLRADGNGFFGAEWQIVTGSGLKLLSGWFTREDAGLAAAAIGRVLPYIDWMSATSEDFTDASKKALAATVRRYHFAGLREDQSEPEPLATT